MTAGNLLGSGFHFQVAFGQHLWNDLFSAALPMQVGGGQFDLTTQGATLMRLAEQQLGSQIHLLSDRAQPLLPPPLQELKSRYSPRLKTRLREGRDKVAQRMREAVKVDGDWTLHVTPEGTRFRYDPAGLSVSAQIRAVADGKLTIQGAPEPWPFKLERLVQGSFDLRDIRYDRTRQCLQGSLRNLHLELGQNAAIKLAERWIDKALGAKVGAFNPVSMLKIAQINDSLAQALGNLHMAAAIDDVVVDISENQLVLKVNFVFRRS